MAGGRAPTGPVAAAVADCRALPAAGVETLLVGRPDSAVERYCGKAGVRFVPGGFSASGARRWTLLRRDLKHLRRVIEEFSPEVVHVHRSDEQFLAFHALRPLRKDRGRQPLLVRSWHRSPARLPAAVRNRLAKSTAGCLCVSRADVELLHRAGAPAAAYLPPGVDTELFRPRPRSQDRDDDGAVRPPLIVGQIGRWKRGGARGQAAALEVFRRLDPALPWRGVLAGRGEGEEELRRKIATLKPAARAAVTDLPARVELQATGDDFPAQAAALDVGMTFSTGSDGSSRPALELLACGVPVLLADLPGLRELSEEAAAATGIRCLPADEYDLWARTVEELLENETRRREAGQAAREAAVRRFSLPRHGRDLTEFYGTLAPVAPES